MQIASLKDKYKDIFKWQTEKINIKIYANSKLKR
jgi:hypothetical protein